MNLVWEGPADEMPDFCPQGCGGVTEDPYGGPCKGCRDGHRRAPGAVLVTVHSPSAATSRNGNQGARLTLLESEAASLERETLFSRREWFHTLLAIDGNPHREALLRAIRDAAPKTGRRPYAMATILLDAMDIRLGLGSAP